SVWLAERADGQLKRQVALKLPRLTWARGLAERMARERDILATLEHPHIARLYDAGVDHHGRPYLALEYVEGPPIDVYARERGLSVRQKLALLLQVCAAVAFAHSRLVVHRDLKPGNILVTADGQVRLLDFGIAKLMEGDRTPETQLTQLSGRALTLDYASPEQIKGEPIGTASDVYSLGVVAYELLTGARPYKLRRGSAAELEEAIATADIAPASSLAAGAPLSRALRGDLDAVLATALARDVARRYATVEALAADLARYLDGRPVEARQSPWGEHLLRLVRRRPLESAVVVGATLAVIGGLYVQVAVTLVFAGGIALALWQRRSAVRQRDLATREKGRADAAAEQARREAERATAAAEAQQRAAAAAQEQARRAEQAKALLLAAFESADVDAGAGRQTAAVDVLRAARDRIDEELAGDPSLALELKTSIAYSLIGSGAATDALALLSSALAAADQRLGPEDARVVAARNVRSEALLALGRAREALDEATWVIESSGRAGDWMQQSIALRHASTAWRELGDLAAGERAIEQAMRLMAEHPEAIGPKERMHVLHSLAGVRVDIQHPEAVETARAAHEAACAYFGPRRAFAPLFAEGQLGLAELKAGQTKTAAERLRGVATRMADVYGLGHRHVGIVLNYLVLAQHAIGDGEGAEVALGQWEESDRASGQPANSAHSARRVLIRGRVMLLQRRPADAVACIEEGNAILAAALPDAAHPVRQLARLELALAYSRAGRPQDAWRTMQEARLSDAEPVRRDIYLAWLLLDEGRWDEALAAAEAAQAQIAADAHPGLAVVGQCALGLAQLETANPASALVTLTAAERRLQDLHIEHSNDLAELMIWRARAQLETGEAEASARSLAGVLASLSRRQAPGRLCALAKLQMARVQVQLGQAEAARRLLEQAGDEALAAPLVGERRWVARVEALLHTGAGSDPA
ncbi:MAG: protein kinase, partial [Rubrivivax sp.]|nr:protein kinase [Rubrivivax sp.]MCA3259805.1 protein kinase [Rubrivivax sp.]